MTFQRSDVVRYAFFALIFAAFAANACWGAK